MATFTDSLVSKMAQNFNEALDGVDPIDLSDDKTLKWRGHLNNKYASTSGRRSIINKKPSLDAQEPISSSPSKPTSQHVENTALPSLKRSSSTADNITDPINPLYDFDSKHVVDNDEIKKDDELNKPKRLLRQKAKPTIISPTEKRIVLKKSKKECHEDSTLESEDAEQSVLKVRKCRTKRNSNDIFEPKTLRSRRSDRQNQQSAAIDCENNEKDDEVNKDSEYQIDDQQLKDEDSQDSIVKPDEFSSAPLKTQQQSSDEEESKHVASFVMTVLDGKELPCKTEEINEDTKVEQTEAPEIQHDEGDVEIDHSSQMFPVASSLNIIVPKKRGRKPGFKKLLNPLSLAIKKSARISRDHDPDPAFDPANKLSVLSTSVDAITVPSQRLSRRIKPTAKILANEELRYGFELQNNARLSLSSENLEAEKSPHKEDKQISPSVVEPIFLKVDTSITEHQPPTATKLPPNESSSRRKAPCPDPVEFINSIKMEKINLHRSPEGNKKMSNKQRKRLLKLKEKHFYKLGLQRSRVGYPDSSHDTTENEEGEEEFVPNSKISVGRPNVTLRLRANTNTPDAPPCSLNLNLKRRKSKYQEDGVFNAKKRVYTVIPSAKHETSLILSTKKKLVNDVPKQLQPSAEKRVANAIDPFICLCAKPSKYYTHRTADTIFCRATDQIEGQLIGCCNEISGGKLLNLLRPSIRVKYSLLCSLHIERLVAHQSCAGCGVFCTQGSFAICPRKHFFHKDCATKYILNAPFNLNATQFVCPSLVLRCPHCGVDSPDQESQITMKCRTIPVFLPSQRQPPKLARMSIGHHTHASGALVQQKSGGGIGQKQFLWELEKLIPSGIMDVLLKARKPDGSVHRYTSKDVFDAITSDNLHRMAEIIATGFDVSAKLNEFRSGTCLHLVSNFGSLAMSYLILCRSPSVEFLNNRDRELRSALMCAVLGAKNDIIRMLVQCGSDVTLRGPGGMTALHLAAKTGNFTAAQIILDSYRRATSATSFGMFVNAVDDGGWTTIVWAAEIGHSDLVEYLVQCGADLSICDAERNTVLHWAALSDDVATVRPLLLEADLNVQNVNGDTPIHIACRNSNIRMCLMFLAHGASLELQNDLGETAYDGIGDEGGACAKAVLFNMKLRALAGFGEQIIVCQDISKGRETYPIKVIKRRKRTADPAEQDLMDDNEVPHFIYITSSIILQSSIQIDRRISQMRVCSCIDNCTSSSCQCSEISVQNWYNAEGRLNGKFNFADPAMIFECNDVCGCNKLHCKNRVVQNGQKVALQVVECGGAKGWGVTAVGDVVRGTFVAEYTGEILTDAEADRRVDDSYFFDLDASEHCIDAHYYGNVSRFFNHSCVPNIAPIRVFYDHQDLRFPKIALFAIRDICAGEEITFDYGDKFWHNKSFACECGADVCRFSCPV